MGVVTTLDTTAVVKHGVTSSSPLQRRVGVAAKPTVHKARRRVQPLPLHRNRIHPIRPRRTVQFNMEANTVKETERTCCRDSKSIFFWTKDEASEIQESNHRLALEYRKEQSEDIAKANHLFRQCYQGGDAYSSSSSSEDEEMYEDDTEEEDALDQEERDECWVASKFIEIPARMRGLEWSFLSASKKHRRVHVQRVLRWQRYLQQKSTLSHNQQDKQAILLSSRAVRSSRPCRVMARIIGDSDARSAKEVPTLRRTRCRMLPTWW